MVVSTQCLWYIIFLVYINESCPNHLIIALWRGTHNFFWIILFLIILLIIRTWWTWRSSVFSDWSRTIACVGLQCPAQIEFQTSGYNCHFRVSNSKYMCPVVCSTNCPWIWVIQRKNGCRGFSGYVYKWIKTFPYKHCANLGLTKWCVQWLLSEIMSQWMLFLLSEI